MKTLIKKADGTPTKSKMHAVQYLSKLGISKDCLIEENGQFFYEGVNDLTPTPANAGTSPSKGADEILNQVRNDKKVTWETEVFDKNNNKTQLIIPNTDVVATINAKLPAGQLRNRSCFELNIGDENFVMSLELVSKIFKVRG